MSIIVVLLFSISTLIYKYFYLYPPVEIKGYSMWPTLKNKEMYFSLPLLEIEHGDIVAFNASSYREGKRDFKKSIFGTYYIKRVIGLPGDIIEYDSKNMQFTINGQKETYCEALDLYIDDYQEWIESRDRYLKELSENKMEKALFHMNKTGFLNTYNDNFDSWRYEVPEGYVFLAGDNREDSTDSRYFGPVPMDYLIKKINLSLKYKLEYQSYILPFIDYKLYKQQKKWVYWVKTLIRS